MSAGQGVRGLAAAVVVGLGLALVAYVGYRASGPETTVEPGVSSRPVGVPSIGFPDVLAIATLRPGLAEPPLPGHPGLLPGVPVRLAPLSEPARTVARTVTDAEGKALFRQLPPEPLLAVARDERYGVGGAVAGPANARKSRPVVFLWMGDGQVLEGRVVDASGAPVAGARIAVHDLGEVLERTSDAEGRFAFGDLVPRDQILDAYRERVGVGSALTAWWSVNILGLRFTKRETGPQPGGVPAALRGALDHVSLRVEAAGYAPWEEWVRLAGPVEVVLRTVPR